MDEAMFAKFITTVSGGPSLVRAADRPEHGQLVSVPSIQLALANLRDRFQYILVDSPPSLNEHILAAVDAADLVWVVTGPSRSELTAIGRTAEAPWPPRRAARPPPADPRPEPPRHPRR